jgi:16S rRNA G1207 methylase RsmC|tara:strand:- start:23 stop:199 length:177 start_codon:yes stop_codon:yes gene_type:complete
MSVETRTKQCSGQRNKQRIVAVQAAPGVFSWGDVDDGDHEVVFTSYQTNEFLVLDYQG